MATIKKFIISFSPFLAFFFAPINHLLIATGILVFCDMITGAKAAQKKGETIHSKKLGRTISKTIFYFMAIILSRVMELVYFPSIPLATITSGYIALVEFKSNIENISVITGTDIWKVLIDKIHASKDAKKGS